MEEIDLKEVYEYYKKHFKKALMIVLAITSLLIVLNIMFKKPLYKSNTTLILINNSTENKINTQDITINSKLIGTYSKLIKSRSVVEQVREDLNLKEELQTLSSKISVTKEENADLLKITVIDRDPEKAKKIADKSAEVFAEKVKEIYNLENIKIVDKAEEPENPYNINYLKDSVIIFVIVSAIAFAVIFLMYYFDNTVKSAEDIENKFGLTVLGEIPDEEGK